jgi:kynureninase
LHDKSIYPLLVMGDSSDLLGRDRAVELDSNDTLRHTRDEFNIPSKADVARKTLLSDDTTGSNYYAPSLMPC